MRGQSDTNYRDELLNIIRMARHGTTVCMLDGGHSSDKGGYLSFVVFSDGQLVTDVSRQTCEAQTGNEAEYYALVEAAGWLVGHGCTRQAGCQAILYSDSQLLVNQVNGDWKVKARNLFPLLLRAWDVLEPLDWRLEWLPRERIEVVLGH